jgi:hypothetical protein
LTIAVVNANQKKGKELWSTQRKNSYKVNLDGLEAENILLR